MRYATQVSQQDLAVLVGARDFGLAVARRLPGHRLIIADLDDDALRAATRTLCVEGFDVAPIRIDVGGSARVPELVRFVLRSGTVRHLIVDTCVDLVDAGVESVLRATLLGPAFILDAFAPIVAAGASGVVICDASAHNAVIDPYDEEALALVHVARLPSLEIAAPHRFPDVCAAHTFAMRGIQLRTRAANAMWMHRGARVNSLTVGVAGTEASPLSGVADVAAFLLSDESRCVGGTDILVDGGSAAVGYGGDVSAEDSLAAN
jgi:NAD(P)-dependent dehydrogenase (short-subunit alcohol dehydrogenase family)